MEDGYLHDEPLDYTHFERAQAGPAQARDRIGLLRCGRTVTGTTSLTSLTTQLLNST